MPDMSSLERRVRGASAVTGTLVILLSGRPRAVREISRPWKARGERSRREPELMTKPSRATEEGRRRGGRWEMFLTLMSIKVGRELGGREEIEERR